MSDEQLLPDVSHEMRTALANVQLYLELLRLRGHDPRQRERYLGVLEREGERLLRLIKAMRDSSSPPEEGRLAPP